MDLKTMHGKAKYTPHSSSPDETQYSEPGIIIPKIETVAVSIWYFKGSRKYNNLEQNSPKLFSPNKYNRSLCVIRAHTLCL